MNKQMNKYSDALKQAFIQADIEDFNSIDESFEWIPSASFERRMNRLIRRRKSVFYEYLNTAWKKAIAITISVLLLFGSMMSISAIRKPIVRFVLEIFDKYTNVSFEEGTEEQGEMDIKKQAPKTIETLYYPTYVPKGYELFERTNKILQTDFIYTNGLYQDLEYQQYVLKSNLSLDTENAQPQSISVGEHIGCYYKNKKKITLIWNTDEYGFIIFGSDYLDISEIMKMALSLEKEK